MRDPNDESADRSEPHPLLSFGRGVLVRLRREPAVAGAIAIAISLALFMAGRLAEEHPWGLADAADALNEAGQLVSLNSSEKVAAEDHLERAARAFAVIAFALFGFEVVRAVGGHAVERGRLPVRRLLQRWSRRPLLRASMPAGTIALHPWGGLDETTSPADVLESRIDERAERVHAAYLAEYPPRPEDRLDHFSSRRPWRDLWSFYRDDNRNCADFLDARLRAVGLRVVRPGDTADFVAPGQISPEQSLVMSRLEHRRWVVSRVLAGWQRGTRNNAGRMHPSICPWGELSAEEQAKDRVVSDLGRALAPGERVGRVR